MMLNSLSSRLAALFTAMFVVLGALLVGVSQHMPELRQMIALGAELLIAAIAFALLTALLVFNLLTRRLHLLAQEIEAFRDNGFAQPARLAWAHEGGDEIHRLGHAFGDLSDRISRQIEAQRQHEAQRRELLANVSHDLRTPLTLMQGYLETLLLRQDQLSALEARRCLEVATRHANRLGRLVGDLFELAKLDGPVDPMTHEAFALAELAQDVAQKFALHAQRRGVHIEARPCAGDGGPALVRGDIGLVERALENLVENALRHTPEGGRVTLALRHEAGSSGQRLRVSVRDTGCGIAPEHLPHVFDRYFQAPRVEDGAAEWAGEPADAARHHAGLGLAITRRIAVLHGGEIRVDSTLGQGTEFSFDLPLAGAHGTARPAALPAGAAAPAALPPPAPAAAAAAPPTPAETAADATRALAVSEQRYALALRGASDGLWEWVAATDRLTGSPRWWHLLGRDDADAPATLGLADRFALMHPDDRPAAEQALQRHLAGAGDHVELTHRLRHADGRYRWVLSRATAVRHASGRVERLVGLDTDVTRIKRVEALVEALAAGGERAGGRDFFEQLVRQFAQALQVACVFITECADAPSAAALALPGAAGGCRPVATRARTLACWRRDGLAANFEYALAGTPCEQVYREGRTCFHPHGVGRLFPREGGQEAYLGLPIFARDGGVIGHLAFLHPEPMPDDVLLESVYRVVTARAGAEIELTQALERLATVAA